VYYLFQDGYFPSLQYLEKYSPKEIKVKKLTFIVCTVMLAVFVSSCGNTDRGDGYGHMYNASLLGNPKSLDPQYASDSSSATVIKNLYSGLMISDRTGNISCCNAESYNISDDGKVYTFNLRKDNYWFFDKNSDDIVDDDECFPVKADDYVFALQRILAPEMQSPYAEDFSCIKGADKVLTGEKPPESAEIYAPDDYTLMIALENPDSEFLSLLSTSASYPCNRNFFYSTKGRYGLDDRSVMSNGAFYVRQWFYDPYGVNNILYMRRNEKNLNEKFDIAPSYLSFSIQESQQEVEQVFKDDETECFTAMDISAYKPEKYSVDSISAVTLGIIFRKGNKYFDNKNIRKAFACSVNRESVLREDTDLQTAYGIIPPAVNILGRSYRELSSDNQFRVYSPDEAKRFFSQGTSELKTESIPEMTVLVNTQTINSSYFKGVVENWENLFGISIGIEDVMPEEFENRIRENDFSIALYPLSADYPNGVSVIRQFEKNDFLRNDASEIKLSDALIRCKDINELVEKYTDAERFILEEYTFIPLFYKNVYLVAYKDNEDIFYDPFSGAVDYRLAKNFD